MWKLLSAAFAMAGAIGGAPAPAAAQTPINVSYQPSLYWALPYYIATEKGWWKDVGLTPGFSVFPAGAPQVAAAQAKSWDVGGTGSVPAVLGAARSGLLTIGITNDESKANVLMVRGEKFAAFKANPQSLKGQRILLTTNSTGDYSVRNCLRKYGVAFSDVQFVNLGQAQIISAIISATATSPESGRRTTTPWRRRPGRKRSAPAPTRARLFRARSWFAPTTRRRTRRASRPISQCTCAAGAGPSLTLRRRAR